MKFVAYRRQVGGSRFRVFVMNYSFILACYHFPIVARFLAWWILKKIHNSFRLQNHSKVASYITFLRVITLCLKKLGIQDVIMLTFPRNHKSHRMCLTNYIVQLHCCRYLCYTVAHLLWASRSFDYAKTFENVRFTGY